MTNIRIPIIVTYKGHNPAIELRRLTTNPEAIKLIVAAAIEGRAIKAEPWFTDLNYSLCSLVEKGILYLNKKENRYYFTY